MNAPEPSSSSKLRAVPIAGAPAGELTFAIDTFLSQPDMPPNTRRSYGTTLRLIEREIGEQPLNAPLLTAIVTQRWDQSSPATWNLRVATVGSFVAYVREQALLEIPGELRLRRHREHHDNTRSIPIASLDRLWQRREIPIRERTLWRMLYETAARADEILGIDIQDLDIPTSAPAWDPRAATPTTSSSKPQPRDYYRDCSAAATADRSSCRTSRQVPHASPRVSIFARSLAERGCRTGAQKSCSSITRGGRCISSGIARLRSLPSRTSPFRSSWRRAATATCAPCSAMRDPGRKLSPR